MDPNAPLTTQPFAQALRAITIGIAAPWGGIVPLYLVIDRWRESRALRKAQAHWEAWQAAHPCEPPADFTRRAQLRDQLWPERQPAHAQAYLMVATKTQWRSADGTR